MKMGRSIAIRQFQGEFRFLSNFWPAKITWAGIEFPSVEHAYQAAKTLRVSERIMIADAHTPGEAKRLGRRISMRKDWNNIRIGVMEELVMQKFKNDPVLKQKLLNTGKAHLEEGNKWGDTFWGTCNGVGENHLGQILMATRRVLRGEEA